MTAKLGPALFSAAACWLAIVVASLHRRGVRVLGADTELNRDEDRVAAR